MLKLNVGWSRKAGEANFGSRGASVNLELEVEAGLVNQPDELQERLRRLYRLAKASVDAELSCDGPSSNGNGHTNGHQGNGHPHRNGETHTNGHSRGSSRTNGRHATASQVRALHAIASRQRFDLGLELRNRFQVDRPDDLSISEASELIDALKPQTNGSNGGRR